MQRHDAAREARIGFTSHEKRRRRRSIVFMAGEELQADLAHRFAMLEDSRVIPMTERPLG
jgi:hypothetical protein